LQTEICTFFVIRQNNLNTPPRVLLVDFCRQFRIFSILSKSSWIGLDFYSFSAQNHPPPPPDLPLKPTFNDTFQTIGGFCINPSHLANNKLAKKNATTWTWGRLDVI